MGRNWTEARYRLAPQMRDYDAMGHVWHPYVMNFHRPGHDTPVLHTDERGFRVSVKDGRTVSNFDGAGGPRALLVGGSVAFGVGASSDAQTIQSILNETSDLTWLNFAGLAISSTQELMLFLFHQRDLGDLKRVVFFSGLNELVMALLGLSAAEGYGPIFNLATYEKRMNGKRLSPQRKLVKAVLEPVKGPRTDWADAPLRDLVFTAATTAEHDRRDVTGESALEHYRKNLSVWKRLCAPCGVELSFVLQPVATWIEKRWAAEEEELFAELDGRPSNTWRILRERFTPEQQQWYAGELRRMCAEEGIAFHDSNEEYGRGRHDGEWLFVDRSHMTDRGNRVAAEYITACGLA